MPHRFTWRSPLLEIPACAEMTRIRACLRAGSGFPATGFSVKVHNREDKDVIVVDDVENTEGETVNETAADFSFENGPCVREIEKSQHRSGDFKGERPS